jgi:hypothetical protein
MIKKSHFLFSLFLIAILFSACNSDTNTTAPVSTGKLFGTLYLSDTNSAAGILVEILGTSHSLITDSSGHWEFELPLGYYNIRISKTGYTHYIASNIAFLGTGNLKAPFGYTKLYRLSNDSIYAPYPFRIDTASSLFNGQLVRYWVFEFEYITVNGKNRKAEVVWFIGRKPHIDYLDNTSYVSVTGSSPFQLTGEYLKSGDTVYLQAYYPYGGFSSFQYYEGEILKTDFYGFGKSSNVVQVVLP